MTTIGCVIPCYNLGVYLRKAVYSALSQARPFDEILVIDDGSEDSTPQVMATLPPVVDTLRTRNRGYARTRNLGARNLTTDVLVFLDADDWLFKDYTQEVLPYFDDPEVGVVCPQVEADGVTVAGGIWSAPQDDDLERLGQQNYVWAASAVRRQVFVTGNGFESQYEPAADWAFWYFTRAAGWRIKGVDKCLWHWRDRPDGLHTTIKDDVVRGKMMQAISQQGL